MLKKLLSIILCLILISSAIGCSPVLDNEEASESDDSQAADESILDDTKENFAEESDDVQKDTNKKPNTDNQDESDLEENTDGKDDSDVEEDTNAEDDSDDSIDTDSQEEDPTSPTEPDDDESTESEKNTNSQSKPESESSSQNSDSSSETEDKTDKIEPIKLSGNNRYKIIYAKDLKESTAKKIHTKLKSLDSNATTNSYYKLSDDDSEPDGSPEILVGLTNRTESEVAQEYLSGYLDFMIAVLGDKIIIYANTEDRVIDAVKYFISRLESNSNGVFYVPETDLYTHTYDNYEFPNFTIAGTKISKFSIVIPSSATDKDSSIAKNIQAWIGENTGATLPIKKDSKAESANEILVGATNRTETSKYTKSYKDSLYYAIETNGTKLVLVTGTSGVTDALLSAFKTKATELKGKINDLSEIKSVSSLNNKKAIFIGNSFIFWGNCVNYINYTNTTDSADLQTRLSGTDSGYFKQICKENGINMTVYNFTYGGKNLEWVYSEKLSKVDDSFFDDIDYVFISEAGENNSTFKSTVSKISKLFTNAEEIVYLAHEYTFRTNATNIINSLSKLSNEGIKVVAWGKLVYDVHTGATSVPGASLSYNKNSFIKNSSGALPQNSAVMSLSGNGDTFHQNPLSGYITAQMCFSAISGCSAQGQKYSFCGDKTLGAQYDFENFLECHYNNGQTSNFIQIFNSSADMAGLQKLMDEYIAQYNY